MGGKTMKDTLLKLIPKESSYGDDSVVIFENSTSLDDESAIMNFRNFLVDNKIKHNIIYDIESFSDKQLDDLVDNCLGKIICFETTGLGQGFAKLKELIVLKSAKGRTFKLIECAWRDCSIGRIPDACADDLRLYTLYCGDENNEKWRLVERKKINT